MTAIIGFSLGSYALIVGDTRSASANGGAARGDDQRKIAHIHFGLFAGAGSAAMIRKVSERIDQRRLGINTVEHVLNGFRTRVLADYSDDREIVASVTETRVIYTYDRIGSVALRLVETTHGDPPYVTRDIETGSAWICGPTPDGDWQDWMAACQDGLSRPDAASREDVLQSVQANTILAAEILLRIAKTNPAVSPTFTVGVHFVPMNMRVSEICAEPPDIEWWNL